jgi:hypothetical protein
MFLNAISQYSNLKTYFKETAQVYFIRGPAMTHFTDHLYKELDRGLPLNNIVIAGML